MRVIALVKIYIQGNSSFKNFLIWIICLLIKGKVHKWWLQNFSQVKLADICNPVESLNKRFFEATGIIVFCKPAKHYYFNFQMNYARQAYHKVPQKLTRIIWNLVWSFYLIKSFSKFEKLPPLIPEVYKKSGPKYHKISCSGNQRNHHKIAFRRFLFSRKKFFTRLCTTGVSQLFIWIQFRANNFTENNYKVLYFSDKKNQK